MYTNIVRKGVRYRFLRNWFRIPLNLLIKRGMRLSPDGVIDGLNTLDTNS